MTNFYMNPDLGYYEGVRIRPDDPDVPQRPSPNYKWIAGEWVVDQNAIVILIQQKIQGALDAIAQSRGYDNIKSACAYASSAPWVPDTDPNFDMCEKFRRQGNYAQNRMSLTWAMCYAHLATVQAGTNPMPTPAEAVAMMPEFNWPE